MTITVVVMIVIGIIICMASFFVSEKMGKKEENLYSLMSVDDDYEFSDRELKIIRRKIEDVIANQAKDILYETNESLSSMANEKTMALGDYAVAVCEQIEKNHKEVMFLYSMLDDKQKDIMKTVGIVNDANKEAKEMLEQVKHADMQRIEYSTQLNKQSALEELTAVSQKNTEVIQEESQQNVPEKQHLSVEKGVSPEYVTDIEDSIGEAESTGDLVEEYEEVYEDEELDSMDIDFDEALDEELIENENSNDIILQMHGNGSSVLDIAKELGLGVGEVKLVIDLYQGK